jgi:hypothetical protein
MRPPVVAVVDERTLPAARPVGDQQSGRQLDRSLPDSRLGLAGAVRLGGVGRHAVLASLVDIDNFTAISE